MIMFTTFFFLKFLPEQGFFCFTDYLPAKSSINNFIHNVHMSMRMPGY